MTPEQIREATHTAQHYLALPGVRAVLGSVGLVAIGQSIESALVYADLLEGKVLLVPADAPSITVPGSGLSLEHGGLAFGAGLPMDWRLPAGRYVLVEGEKPE